MPVFLNPWALSGLALASAPIIIHLLNRRRFKVVEWAAMEFLLASNRKNYRRVRLEQLILLALRVLLIAVLVLIVGRPQVQRRALAALVERQRFVLLAFDPSMSMGYRDGSMTCYDRGLAFADQLMASLREGDTWALVSAEGSGRALAAEPSFDLEAARGAVARDRLPLSDADASLPAALALADDILSRVRTPTKGVCVVTDMQRGSWVGPTGSVAAEDVERAKRIGQAARLVIVDVGADKPVNLALTALETDGPLVVAGGETLLRARVANYGPETASGVTIGLFVDGFRQQTSAPRDIAPGGAAQWEFRYSFRTAGSHAVTAELDADNLPKDNRRFLAIEARENIPILCVDGKPGTELFTGGTDYLRQALKPAGGDGADRVSLFEPEAVPAESFTAAELARYDAIVLANVARLDEPAVASLDRYVREGGTLVVFPGDKVDRGFYNSALYRKGEGLLPCSLGDVVGDAADRKQAIHISSDVGDHPFVRLFREQRAIRLSSPAFFRYCRLENLRTESGARVVCTFENGAPATVEGLAGKGRVVVFASTADDEWNDMPSWPAYLALMQEILGQAARDPGVSRNLSVGEPIVRHLPPRLFGKTVRLVRPGQNQPVLLTATTTGGMVSAAYDRTDRAGIYEMTVDAEGPGNAADRLERRQDFFAVNVPARESDLRRISPEDLRKVLPGVEFDYQRGGGRQAPAEAAAQSGEIWRSLAYSLLALLLLESVLAQRFGR